MTGAPAQGSPYAPNPARVQDAPSRPYSPFRAPDPAPPSAAPPPARSRRRLAIGLAAGGAAVVGGIVAIALLAGDDEPARTRDAVIKQTFAALAAGDGEALFALAEPARTFETTVRCDKHRSDQDHDGTKLLDDYRDPAKIDALWKKNIEHLLRRTKGSKLEVVDILTEMPPPMGTPPRKKPDEDKDRTYDEDRPVEDRELETTTFKKGNDLPSGCYAKTAFRSQLVKTVIDIKDGDREVTQRVLLLLNEIDGNWYLAALPHLGVGLDVMVADVEAYRDQMCKCTDAACVEEVGEANRRLDFAQGELGRDDDLPKETLLKLERIQRELRTCEGTALGGPELARYKALKDQLCACKDDACGRTLETEMAVLRPEIEGRLRRARASPEATTQLSDLAIAASTCTRKLARTRVTLLSVWPADGELAGGTIVTIRGTNLTAVPRTAKVFFGGTVASSAHIANNYDIVAEAPPHAAGTVEVRVQLDPGGTLAVPYGFTYREPFQRRTPAKKKPATADKANPFE